MMRAETEGNSAPPGGLGERLYKALDSRYPYALLVAAGASIVALTAVAAALAFPYVHGSPGAYWRTLAFALPWMALVATAAELAVARQLAPLLRWLGESRPVERARAAWGAAVAGGPRGVLIGATVVIAGAIPAEIWGAHQFRLNAGATVATVVAITAFILAGGALHYLLWERGLLPVVRDIARDLPDEFHAPQTGHTLSRKLIGLVIVANVEGCVIAAGVSTDSLGPGGKIALGIGAAVVVAATLTLAMTLLLRRSMVAPLSELLSAMDRVGGGDLEVQLMATSADEFGSVRRHFNEMVDGLRDRQSLREQNVELIEELAASRARIVTAADNSRRQVERDLHDGAQQRLVLLQLKLSLAERLLDSDPAAAKTAYGEVREELEQALAELRELAHGIYPAVLENEGLPAALKEAAGRSAIPVNLESDNTGRYPPPIEAAVYFCCLEALQNAAKHAGEGAKATIQLTERDGALWFVVADTGQGFDAARVQSSSGIQNMTDRVGALDGRLELTSTLGVGTKIAGTIPLNTNKASALGRQPGQAQSAALIEKR